MFVLQQWTSQAKYSRVCDGSVIFILCDAFDPFNAAIEHQFAHSGENFVATTKLQCSLQLLRSTMSTFTPSETKFIKIVLHECFYPGFDLHFVNLILTRLQQGFDFLFVPTSRERAYPGRPYLHFRFCRRCQQAVHLDEVHLCPQ